jgi:microsomal dipeptidase-like Zn-dependent dipeptidase
MPNIVAELDRRGLRSDDIAKIFGGNWRRIFADTFPGDAVATR